MRFVFFGAWALALVLFVPHGLFATPQSSTDMLRDAGNPTALNVLIEEAKKNDPAIRVADTAARAATFAAPQM